MQLKKLKVLCKESDYQVLLSIIKYYQVFFNPSIIKYSLIQVYQVFFNSSIIKYYEVLFYPSILCMTVFPIYRVSQK